MKFMNRRRGIALALLVGAFVLPHCGVDGNPFYLGLSPTPRFEDVLDAGGADTPASDMASDDVVVALDVPADDGSVAPDVVTVDAVDGSPMSSDQPDSVVVIADADLADMVDAAVEVDVVIAPDVVTGPDVVDAGAGPDVVSPPDLVPPPDVVMMSDVVDVVLAMDVVDVVAPQDRPDVVIGMDTTDVVMTPDRPDVVQPDIPPPLPEFVVEYVRDYGNNSVPGPGEQVSVIGVAFYADNRWTRYDLVASRFASSPDRYRATIPVLSSSQQAALTIALSLPAEGCGSRIQMGCPMGWQLHWFVMRLGRSYYGNTTTTRGDASVPVMVHERNCTDYGFSGTECITCTAAP